MTWATPMRAVLVDGRVFAAVDDLAETFRARARVFDESAAVADQVGAGAVADADRDVAEELRRRADALTVSAIELVEGHPAAAGAG